MHPDKIFAFTKWSACQIKQTKPNSSRNGCCTLKRSVSGQLLPFMSRPQDDRNQEATVYLVCVISLISTLIPNSV